jgi:sugar phosphate isomerase/epimerase
MLFRRSLLPLLAGLGVSPEAGAQTPMPLPGLQLYTVRDALRADLDGTLRTIADIGYREVELAGFPGVSPGVFREKLRQYGLTVPSIHAGYESLRDDIDGVLDEARLFEASFLVCPFVDARKRRTMAEWKRVCRTLNWAGRTMRNFGYTLAYHNHDDEFTAFAGGATPFDMLIAETDPQDVKLELDVYWLARAGLDPVRTLEDNRDRLALVHLKDMARSGETAELGAGVLPMERIVRAALTAGAKHLFVEQDTSADPLGSIAVSWRFLKGLPAAVTPR